MISFLTYLVIALGVITLVQLVRVYELTRELRGTKAEDIPRSEHKMNGTLMLSFMIALFAFVAYHIYYYNDKLLPVSASEHGASTDALLTFNFIIILAVFVITHIFLFWFAFKYYYREERKATYFTHSTKLEMIWTVIPAIFLAVIIVYGLSVWTSTMMSNDDEEYADAIVIELYSKQFDWTARYAGKDNELGRANYRLINGANFLGIDSSDVKAGDDVIVKGEFHLPVNRAVKFQFRSQDVIHSAYMPHFRAQMNTVPGMTTTFLMKPTITTAEMRANPDVVHQFSEINKLRRALGKPEVEFTYILLCNKICGASHYNMQMDVVVESEEEYNKWMDSQKIFAAIKATGDSELAQKQ